MVDISKIETGTKTGIKPKEAAMAKADARVVISVDKKSMKTIEDANKQMLEIAKAIRDAAAELNKVGRIFQKRVGKSFKQTTSTR